MDLKQKIKELRKESYVESELSVDPLWYIIWEPENIDEYNKDYGLAEYAPGFTAEIAESQSKLQKKAAVLANGHGCNRYHQFMINNPY